MKSAILIIADFFVFYYYTQNFQKHPKVLCHNRGTGKKLANVPQKPH